MADASGRGSTARRPRQIPPRGWKEVLKRVFSQAGEDNLSVVAAGVAFYALLAFFPAIAAFITIYGLIFDPAQVSSQLEALQPVVPQAAYDIISKQLNDVAQTAGGALTLTLLGSLAFSLWSSLRGVKALMRALNIAYEEDEQRNIFRFNYEALLLVLVSMAFAALSLILLAGLPAALAFLGVGGVWSWLSGIIRWVLMALMVVALLGLFYRYGPCRSNADLPWVTPGALAGTALWVISGIAFSFYVANFGSYNETFGSLGAVVVLLLWFYISAFVICLGAELNAELEMQTKEDSTVGPERPMGERGAHVADHWRGEASTS